MPSLPLQLHTQSSYLVTPGARARWFLLFLLFTLPLALAATPSNKPASHVLLLYDAGDPQADTDWVGPLFSQLVLNILGHFPVTVTSKPLAQYQQGDLDRYDATIYLGLVAQAPLPADFRREALTTTHTLCWVHDNLGTLACTGEGDQQRDDPAFVRHFGIRYVGEAAPGNSTVLYRNRQFTRIVEDEHLLETTAVVDPALAQVVASATPASGPAVPYIVHAANLWFVADDPFQEATQGDRYLAFADVLHDVLGIHHLEKHRAMVRIEDIHPLVSPERLRNIADVCKSLHVPFSVAVIPLYTDPLGVNNHGKPRTVAITDMPKFVAALHYMQQCGGEIVMHGYTHQYGKVANPEDGVSADDAEFMRQVKINDNDCDSSPVPEDSAQWAAARVLSGKQLLARCHLTPVAWDTPHYIASPTDYRQFAKMFPRFVDRAEYYATDKKGKTHMADQIVPYVLRDVYGCLRVPETLGYIEMTPSDDNPNGSAPKDLARYAEATLAVRDGWASFFFHPYLDPALLKDAITRIKALGYTFVAPSSVTASPATW